MNIEDPVEITTEDSDETTTHIKVDTIFNGMFLSEESTSC